MAEEQPRHWLDSLSNSLSGASLWTPELGSFLANAPEKAAQYLASLGVPPPPRPGVTYTPPETEPSRPFAQLPQQLGGLASLLEASPEQRSGQVVGAQPSQLLPDPMEAAGYPPAMAENTYKSTNAQAEAVPSVAPTAPAAPTPANVSGAVVYNPLAAPALTLFPRPPVASVAPSKRAAPALAAPLDIRSDIQKQQDATGAETPTNDVSGLAKVLSGIKAPALPAVQKLSSPSVPRPGTMPQGSPIAALLAKAVAGDPQAMLTLRLAIGGGR